MSSHTFPIFSRMPIKNYFDLFLVIILVSHRLTLTHDESLSGLQRNSFSIIVWFFPLLSNMERILLSHGEEQFYNSNTQCYYQFVSDSSIMKIILA